MKKLFLLIALSLSSFLGVTQSWDEIIKATASDGSSNAHFGQSVSISGDKALVGAPFKNFGAGSVYVLELTNSIWIETAILTASNGFADDRFGYAVSINGDKAIVGAFGKTSNTGAAYIFELSGSIWGETAILTASDGAASDEFGTSVSLSGDKAIVGAHRKNSNTGSAYVFELTNGTWTETAILTASDGASGDRFAQSVSISGDKALVGAWTKNSDTGSAYVFELTNGAWAETAILTASDGASGDNFGFSVNISGGKVLVSASGKNSNTGSAYVFELTNGTWPEIAILIPSDGTSYNMFGQSVSINGDKAIVGANGKNSHTGSAYIFELTNGTWTETAMLIASDGANGDNFGHSVSISGNKAIVGAYSKNSDDGSAYIFCTGCIPVGVKGNNTTNATVFPNPTRKEVTLSLTENVKIELTDINGKTLFTDKKASGVYTIDLSSYSKGLYFVNISNQKGSATYKVIKE